MIKTKYHISWNRPTIEPGWVWPSHLNTLAFGLWDFVEKN